MFRKIGFYLLLCLSISNVFAVESSTLKNLQDQTVDLKEYSSKLIVVNFWAVWCKPCVQEFPELNALYQQLKNNGVMVVAVSVSPSKEDIQKFLDKNKVDFPVLIDENEGFANKFKVSVLPTTVLIDHENKVLYKYQGFSKKEILKMQSLIEDYLKK
ncbi:MAG: TlpA family protein disulfide reductase [Spirochaetia bacterium]|nr:TlpA family protein disulfide reductase [Spirochaetia bacterium]